MEFQAGLQKNDNQICKSNNQQSNEGMKQKLNV